MNSLAIFTTRLKSFLSDIPSLSIILIGIVMSVALSGWQNAADDRYPVSVVNEDRGEYGELVVSQMEKEEGLKITRDTLESASEKFHLGKTPCVLVIHEDFTKKLKAGDHKDLIAFRASQDNLGSSYASETAINATLKIWAEEYSFLKLQDVTGNRGDRAAFDKMAEEIWAGGSHVSVDGTELLSSAPVEEQQDAHRTALPLYAAFAMFYLLIGGTWMIRLQNSGLLERSAQKNYSLVTFSLMEGLPGVLIALTGAIPAILLSEGAPAFLQILHMLLYLLSALGITFTICSVCRTFSTLIYASLTVTGIFSAYSGMFTKLPEWSSALKWFKLLLPGYYFMDGIQTGGSMIGALLCMICWIAVGFLAVFLRKKSRT